jgi:hypothetical protein
MMEESGGMAKRVRRAAQVLAALELDLGTQQELLISTAAGLPEGDPLRESIIDVVRRSWRMAYITRPDGSFVEPLTLRDRADESDETVAVNWLDLVVECRNRVV